MCSVVEVNQEGGGCQRGGGRKVFFYSSLQLTAVAGGAPSCSCELHQ